MPLDMTALLCITWDRGGHAVTQQHTFISEFTAAFENTPELACLSPDNGTAVLLRAQVGIRAQCS